MKTEPIYKTCNFKELDFGSSYDLTSKAYDEMHADISRKREDQIIAALKKRGYVFQNKEQLYEFAKRCELRSFESHPYINELWYEDELVCTFSDKITTKHERNSITSTMIVTVG